MTEQTKPSNDKPVQSNAPEQSAAPAPFSEKGGGANFVQAPFTREQLEVGKVGALAETKNCSNNCVPHSCFMVIEPIIASTGSPQDQPQQPLSQPAATGTCSMVVAPVPLQTLEAQPQLTALKGSCDTKCYVVCEYNCTCGFNMCLDFLSHIQSQPWMYCQQVGSCFGYSCFGQV